MFSNSRKFLHIQIQNLNKLMGTVPVISNQTSVSTASMVITPTMCATGSLSMTVKEKTLSSKASGEELGSGFGIHSMCRRHVDDLWGRPLSTALIYRHTHRVKYVIGQ